MVITASCMAGAIKNPTFDDGLKGWKITYDTHHETKSAVLKSRGVKGGKCLKLTVKNPYSVATLEQTFKLPDPKKHYLFSFSTKTSSPEIIGGVFPLIEYQNKRSSKIKAKGDGWAQGKAFYMYLHRTQKRRGWVRRSYFVPAVTDAAQVRIMVNIRCAPGEVLLDDFALTTAPGRGKPADILHYTPFLNCGYSACDKIVELQKKNSPFTKSNELYNKTLMLLTDAQERLERLERAEYYVKTMGAANLRNRFEEAEKTVARLYSIYGGLYLKNSPEKLAAQFDPEAKKCADTLAALIRDLDASFASIAKARGLPWSGDTDYSAVRPISLSGKSTNLNRLVFSSLSKHYHYEMEKVIGDFLQVRAIFKIAPKLRPNGTFYWKRPKSYLESARKIGIKHFITTFRHFVHGIAVEPEFAATHKDDPEINLQTRNFKMPEKKPTWTGGYNYFNPAVRESAKKLIRKYFVRIRDHLKKSEAIIFVVNWEDMGPYAVKDGGLRMVGYGKVGTAEFRAHLKRKYEAIKKLNKAHRSKYKSFDEINPPDQDMRQPWHLPEPVIPRIDPIRYEFSSWTHLTRNKYCGEIYREIKKTDPEAIVFSDYNYAGLCLGYDPLALFEGCDWLNNHGNAYRQLLPQSAMFASLKRYHGKQLATFEDHWGRQDDEHRPGEEIAKRLNIIRHIGRLAARGYLFQSWWYSYTGGTYVVTYGSANWADPVFDLTTFRYCATGLRTGFERARRFEKQFVETTKRRSRIVLIVPEVTQYHQFIEGKTHATIRDLYRLLYNSNRRFEFLTEKLILSGRAKLSEYDVVLLPYAPYFPGGLWEKLTPWVDAGGTLIAVGPCGVYDEFGYDNPKNLFKPMVAKPFPEEQLNTRGPWTWDNGEGLKSITRGKGKLVQVSSTPADMYTSTPLTKKFMSLVGAPLATSPDTPAEVELRGDKNGNAYIFALNPLTDAPIDGHIKVSGKFTKIKDLGILNGLTIPTQKTSKNQTTFKFRLAPGQYTFYELKR